MFNISTKARVFVLLLISLLVSNCNREKFPLEVGTIPADQTEQGDTIIADDLGDEGIDWEVKTLTGSPNNNAALAYRSYGIVMDSRSNLYITHTLEHRILKIDSTGEVVVFAGSSRGYQDGEGETAQFYQPHGLAIDEDDNLYIADTNNHRIRKIEPSGRVSTIAGSGIAGAIDGQGTSAQFNQPQGVAVDRDGNLYIADTLNHRIRKIDATGQVTTIAGSQRGYLDGRGTDARFNFVFAIVISPQNVLYVADSNNNRIRAIDPMGQVTTVAGSGKAGTRDGRGVLAEFNQPHGLAIDDDNNLYIVDMRNHRIRKIDPSAQVSTITGSTQGLSDGIGAAAQFNQPYAIALVQPDRLYIADTYNYRIRLLEPR